MHMQISYLYIYNFISSHYVSTFLNFPFSLIHSPHHNGLKHDTFCFIVFSFERSIRFQRKQKPSKYLGIAFNDESELPFHWKKRSIFCSSLFELSVCGSAIALVSFVNFNQTRYPRFYTKNVPKSIKPCQAPKPWNDLPPPPLRFIHARDANAIKSRIRKGSFTGISKR